VENEINICIVVPCFNEEKNFSVKKFEKVISTMSDVLLCFVDDGSRDRTPQLLESLKKLHTDKVDIITHSENKGKAEAVRTGILHCNNNYNHSIIAFLDADLSTSLEECLALRPYLKDEIEFCFASRTLQSDSNIQIKYYRFIIGRLLRPIIWKILGIKIYDTQCGCKLFTKNLSIELFKDEFISKWLFDIELFARTKKKFGEDEVEARLCEVPVKEWIDSNSSSVKISYFFNLWSDLIKIRNQYSK